jgi:endo-1,4-beta-xylanase
MMLGFVLISNAEIKGQAIPPIAAGKSKFLGNIYSAAQLPGFNQYWNQVTPENAGKWGSVEATRDVMNWSDLDAAYKLAKDNGFPFKLHVLIWGSQQPAWIENLPPAEQLEEIKEWFSLLAQRYPALDFIEVVNEPINAPPNKAGNGHGNYLAALGGTGTSQYDWVLTSFRLARQYFPDSKLMINEYNLVNSAGNTAKYSQIIELLKREGLIDGIGIQAHAFSTKGTSAATINANLTVLAAKGLPIYVTELDVDGLADNTQLQEYKRVFPLFWENPAIRGVTLWGWRPGLWRDAQGANLITANGKERPALTWLRTYVASTVTGLKQKEIPGLDIYPNPVTGNRLSITGLERNSFIQVRDMLGHKVQEARVTIPGPATMDLKVVPGIYLLLVTSGEKQSLRKIMVK